MKSLTNVFDQVRSVLAYVNKASKILRSVELVGKHFTNLVDDLEDLWEIKRENLETTEV